MFKEILKSEQDVVYKTLQHALLTKKVAHAYIFNGPTGTLKKEAAYLLAQSLVCSNPDEDGFACEQCNECQRIKEDNFADMIVLDGSETSIKKENILKLQYKFNKTGLEHTGKKIYVLNRAENATPDALNSLLKFLEEPGSDMIAILLVEQMDRLLPTIVSRCQIIPFVPMTSEHCFQLCKADMEELDAYLLSNMIHNRSAILEAQQSDEFQHAKYVFKKFQDEFIISPYYALSILQQEGFDGKKKRNGKRCMQYFLDMLLSFYKDVLQEGVLVEDTWYASTVSTYRKKNYDIACILQVILSCEDMLFRSVNLGLLSDQFVYQLKEVVK